MSWNITSHGIWSSINKTTGTGYTGHNYALIMYLFSDMFTEYKTRDPDSSESPSRLWLSIDLDVKQLISFLNLVITKSHVREVIIYDTLRQHNGSQLTSPQDTPYPYVMIQGVNPTSPSEEHPEGYVLSQEFLLPIVENSENTVLQPDRAALEEKPPAYRFVHDIPCAAFNCLLSKENPSNWTTLEFDPKERILHIADRTPNHYTSINHVKFVGPTQLVTEADTLVHAYSSSSAMYSTSSLSSSSSSSSSSSETNIIPAVHYPDVPSCMDPKEIHPNEPSPYVTVDTDSLISALAIQPKHLNRRRKKEFVDKTRKQKISSNVRVFCEVDQPLYLQYIIHMSTQDATHSRIEACIPCAKSIGMRPSELFGKTSEYPLLQWTECRNFQFWSALSDTYLQRMVHLQLVVWILLARSRDRWKWLVFTPISFCSHLLCMFDIIG